MSGALVNLLRDMHHTDPETADGFGFGSAADMRDKEAFMSGPGLVFQTKGTAMMVRRQAAAGGTYDWRTAGLLMSPPLVDDTPYRVKMYCGFQNAMCFFFTGYGPMDPDGNNDLITGCTAVPLSPYLEHGSAVFDDIVNIPGRPPGHPDYNKPIAFGMGVALGGANHLGWFHLSVQNLSKTAPQFAASMS